MQDKIKNILEKINLNSSYFPFFENCSSFNCSYNQEKKFFKVDFELDNPLPSNVYLATLNALRKYLSQKEEVDVALYIHLTKRNDDIKIVKDYILCYLEEKENGNSHFDFIKKQVVSIHDSYINIKFNSIFIEDALNDIKPKLERFLAAAGFTYLKIKYIYIEPDSVNDFDYEKDRVQYQKLREEYTQMKEKEAKEKEEYEKTQKPAKSAFSRPNFKNKTFYKYELDQIPQDVVDVESEVKVFDVVAEGKSNKRFKLNVTNFKTSYTCHIWVNKNVTADMINSTLNKWIIIRGTLSYNQFDKENSFELYNFEITDRVDPVRTDDEPVKRVELHAHTNMSAMDGICDVSELVKQAAKWGHKAIAITDHVAVQSFPDAQRTQAKLKKDGIDIKILYGIELNITPKALEISKNPTDIDLKSASYVFFDLETSGLSCEFDDIIEFGAVKVENGVEVNRLDILINPGHPVSAFTTSLTHITNEMLASEKTLKEVLPQILEFMGDSILVAHNASFDIGFIEHAIGHPVSNPCIDTLPLCRYLYQDEKRFTLGAMCRLNGIDYDEESAHRADYDAFVLKELYDVLLGKLATNNIAKTHQELSKLQSKDVIRKMHPYHTSILVKNMVGMKNLFKILSIANTDYFTAQALVPPFVVDEHRDGLIIGSACARGEIFELASTKSKERVIEAMKWYDYIEIQPLDQYQVLVDTERVESMDKVKQIVKFIIECANECGKPICATGDSHYIDESQHIAREVFISTPAIGGGYHPLFDFKHRVKQYPVQEFKTTRQMLDAFAWCGDEKAIEYVITNPNKIADEIEYCYPIKDKLYPPSIPDSDEQLEKACYETAHKMYGEVLPEIVKARLDRELKCIIGNGYSIMYVIAAKCVRKSAEDGFLVGSRGSVGSSFAATCSGITEVNPLPPHYRCPHCGYSDFNIDPEYRSGYDLPDKNCPKCGTLLKGDGHNIPFETFLGFNGDKVPDIDLNFSALNQATAHLFIREMFGEDHVFRAGTIATAASKTAFGYAKKYYETKGVEITNAEAARIAKMCEGVKRTTGQHPGGLIVIPNDMDVYDFTAVGHPADDIESDWLTTHFAFESIHDNVLKLDMLGHVDPTAIRMLQNLTNIDPKTIPMNDPEVIKEFNGDSLLEHPEELTACGLPEFGTNVSRKMLIDSKPKSFADLTKVSGLSHGTDVFFGNARDLILDGTCTMENCIGCRDDIMLGLIDYGLDKLHSFKIMEAVRKGKGLTPEQEAEMREHGVPDWYIGACKKIKYMFPKAHAVAYCMMSVRIAWWKKYYPLEYYATYFTTRTDAFDIEAMAKGIDVIKSRYFDIQTKKSNNEKLSVKENALDTFYEVAIEMYQRGITFSNISLEKSMNNDFVVDHEANQIIPPFRVCDGIGDNAALSVVEARKSGPFISKEDLIERTKLNGTNIKLLEKLGVLNHLDETAQLTLFNFQDL